jgi:tetratricopeptide (TPR) repeat protein
MNKIFLLFTILLTFSNANAQDNNDGLLITQARLAIDKYADYKEAVNALKKVSTDGQKEAIYSFYLAKAYEGLNDYKNAYTHYNQYAVKTKMTPELMEKIADLKYKNDKAINQAKDAIDKVKNDATGNYSFRSTHILITGWIYNSRDIIVKQKESAITILDSAGDMIFEGKRNNNELKGFWYATISGTDCNYGVIKKDCTADISISGKSIVFKLKLIACEAVYNAENVENSIHEVYLDRK